MAHDSQKQWIDTEVGQLLDAIATLAKVAHERANTKPPGFKRPLMSADYRGALQRLERNAREIRTRYVGRG